jgi:hypothetical protein
MASIGAIRIEQKSRILEIDDISATACKFGLLITRTGLELQCPCHSRLRFPTKNRGFQPMASQLQPLCAENG